MECWQLWKFLFPLKNMISPFSTAYPKYFWIFCGYPNIIGFSVHIQKYFGFHMDIQKYHGLPVENGDIMNFPWKQNFLLSKIANIPLSFSPL